MVLFVGVFRCCCFSVYGMLLVVSCLLACVVVVVFLLRVCRFVCGSVSVRLLMYVDLILCAVVACCCLCVCYCCVFISCAVCV